MRRRYWVIVVAIPLLLLAAEVAYWRIAAERLRTGYHDWLAEQTAAGLGHRIGPLSIGGWPRAATVTVPNLTLRHAGPTIPGDVNVASAGVTLSVSLFDPTNLRLSLMGPMHVRAGDLPDVIVTGDEASVQVPLQQTDSLSVALHANGLRLEAATGAWHVTVGLLNADAVDRRRAPGRSIPAGRHVFHEFGGHRPSRGHQMAAGSEYLVAVDGWADEWPAAQRPRHHGLGRGLARRRRVAGDLASGDGVGAAGADVLGDAGAG